MKRNDLHVQNGDNKEASFVSGQEGLQELKKFAIRFQEKIYTTATNQVFA